MVNLILTSYERPRLLRRCLRSIVDQDAPGWTCWILDDGSGDETQSVIAEFVAKDERFVARRYDTTPEERARRVPYSRLINGFLPGLKDGVVGYVCDNVEYSRGLVGKVEAWFAANPDCYAGFVPMRRDVWEAHGRDGLRRLGAARDWGHWDVLPPVASDLLGPGQCLGMLDHSQVFHRLPTEVRWPEDTTYTKCGDGTFFEALVRRYGSIHRIAHGEPLVREHLLKGRREVHQPEG